LLPTGITNPNEAALLEPVFVTLAADPAGPFDVYATTIVAAVPFVPAGPAGPVPPNDMSFVPTNNFPETYRLPPVIAHT
jgi:hypothetical protein